MSDQHPHGGESLSLLFAFVQDDPQFALGFEAGRIHGLIQSGKPIRNQSFHAANAEMVLRIAEAAEVEVTASFTSDPEWMILNTAGEGYE